ncbi:hypothetical protein C8J57DRAFT_1493201 [Mycena rebaudengoi]|nr:hypothetical protein C8J57DRAFT_1493201 [Mycena rebaudengoi]
MDFLWRATFLLSKSTPLSASLADPSRPSLNLFVILLTTPAAALLSANQHLFANNIAAACTAFGAYDTSFRLFGLGVCAFLAGSGRFSNADARADACFTKLYKMVFPAGLDAYRSPVTVSSRNASTASLASSAALASLPQSKSARRVLRCPHPHPWHTVSLSCHCIACSPDFGLFDLVFSLLPKRVQ